MYEPGGLRSRLMIDKRSVWVVKVSQCIVKVYILTGDGLAPG
jgi:hypothetical protein